MPAKVQNYLSLLREKRGLGAADLARRIGVTRQTVYAIEAGSYVPNTLVALKLAQALEVNVEDLFRLEDNPAPAAHTAGIELLPGGQEPQPGQPVRLCRVDRHTIGTLPEPLAWYLPPADGVLVETGGVGKTRRARLFEDAGDSGKRLLVAGCDPGISVLARHLQKAGVELVIAHRNSSQALELLRGGWIHAAGSHLRDQASGESNLPAVRKLFPKRSAAVISFAVWEEGLVVARGNPKGIRGVADLAETQSRMMNREPGAGSRLLFDSELERLSIPAGKIGGYERIAQGHLAAAWQVSIGNADCCVATRAAARVFGLDFLPLLTERYDLVIRRPHLDLPGMQILLDTLSRASFRRELEGLGGYDVRNAGEQRA
ncbi:MAG: substrate-binding domain-containing protein [Bryobacteraceae bacterium]